MSEQVVEKKEKDNKKLIIIIIVIAAVLIIAGLVTVIIILLGKEKTPDPIQNTNNSLIKYEPGAVILDPNDLQHAYDEAVQKTKDGYITLDFANYAESQDGENFYCRIGNSKKNTRDAFFNIYLDSSYSEQVLLTGLIPPGSGIEEFKSEIKLDPGEYVAVLVVSQVDDTHANIISQVSIEYTLRVK